ncbi:hypothetical protein [Schumannella sp. 10F1B-5-1]|uniref:hypothetical protein n=1 Tax=Schumannella sp. 10F1B-5-1 TaxID=2590780 RepID=UPI001131DB5B|nr:hypothetical protein [Schumannella sp. 10F1B-5-1]TPW72890.1 hypothetical protein FJ658_06425 [Schumannella sp. 10F1B-5-1]
MAIVAVVIGVAVAQREANTASQRSAETVSCDEVLESVVALERAGRTSGAIDEQIQWLSDNCKTEFGIATGYFSGKSGVSQFGAQSCADLEGRIPAESITLLREDAACTDTPVPAWSPPATPVTTAQPGGGIPWNEAKNHVGSTQRVCGPLAGGGNSDDDVFLNLGLDYPDPDRFQIVVWDIGSLESIGGGSMICIEGPITSYQGVAQIEIYDPSRIEIYS